MELTKRIDLNVGFMCNANCKFCYYQNSRTQKTPSFEKLKSMLSLARRLGMESVEFTGGEPTMREDIFELIACAKQLGFKRICMITNGILFRDKEIVKVAEESGLEEIKLSIHASKACAHDDITGTQKSFKHVLEGIRNIKKTKLKIKTNTIINRLNYESLPEIAKFLATIKPDRINLKFVTPILDAENLNKEIIVAYSKAMPYLHKTIDILKAKDFMPTVRYVPFCFMQGYEKHVCNLCQVQYDPDEWDYMVKNRLEYNSILTSLNQILGYINMLKRTYIPKKDIAHRAVIESKLLRLTTKGKTCKKCKYDLICDGLWKNYAKLYGYSELKPVIGKKIKEPYAFTIK